MSEKEFDIDKEIEKISRKSNINMRKSEYSFENRLKKLDKEIDEAFDKKVKSFDDSKKLTSDYLNIDYKQDTINRYKEKLNKL